MWKDLLLLWKLTKTYLEGKTGAILTGLFTALVFSLAGLATPYITKFLIDVIFYGARGDLLLPLLLVCAAILVIMSLTGIVSEYILINTFERAKLLMRQDLFGRLQKARRGRGRGDA
jgi:ATP-binding cassette subfamily B protein